MVIDILLHTPGWVGLVLAALVGLGLSQTRPREASVGRVIALPVAMVSLSIFGVLSTFGPSLLAVASWAAGLVVALVVGPRAVAVEGATWSPARQRLQLPGSWLPLGLILAIFVLKFAAGVAMGLQPARAADPVFAGGFSLAYGVFSGLFLARGLSLRAIAARGQRLQTA